MDTVLGPLGVRPSGVFLDLGISSPQFDDASRGFRPEQDGPLDLRFDVTRGEPASEFLRRVDRDELVRIIEEYGETTDPIAARRVADAVVLAREEGTLPSTTKAFAALVAAAKGKEYQAMHPAKLTFQALRIHLNQEFDEMRRGMRAAVEVMGDGGRLGVLTVRRSAFRTRAAAVFYFTAFSREGFGFRGVCGDARPEPGRGPRVRVMLTLCRETHRTTHSGAENEPLQDMIGRD